MDKPDDDFDERYRKKVLPLVQQLAAEGRMRRDDDKALLMYPEGTDVEGTKTMIYCRECLVLIEVRHRSPFSQLTLSPCPICRSQTWEETDVQEGETDGHLSAPRIPLDQLAYPTTR